MGKDQKGKKHEFRRKDHRKSVEKAKKHLGPAAPTKPGRA